ncbi:MAG: metallophosphoesterase family protein [Anaerolineae bacterium]
MTSFVVITDTHLDAAGGEPVGYHQQPRYALLLPALLAELEAWMEGQVVVDPEEGTVDFVLHLGDIVDRATPAALRSARDAYDLSVPTYLCLGNHDVATPDEAESPAELWIREAPGFFPGGELTATIEREDCVIHIAPPHWCDIPYFWREEQRPHFLPEQRSYLETALARRPDLPHILCTHADVLGAPPDQTGFATPYHSPPAEWTAAVLDLVARYPSLYLVLAGHNHINTHQVRGQAHVVTGSAFVETPFEFKLIRVTSRRMTMMTVPLLPRISVKPDYDWNKTFVQGRRCDRAFEVAF